MKPTPIIPRNVRQSIDKTRKKAKLKPRPPQEKRIAPEEAVMKASPKMPEIELFQREDCPFSHAVREKLSALGLDYIAHSVPKTDLLKHKELYQAGGKDEIPFLIDHRTGVKLYGSKPIVAYLENEYELPEPAGVARLQRALERRVRLRVERVNWRLRKINDLWQTIAGTARVLGKKAAS